MKAFPGEEAIDDLAGWLTKYNHCHGPDGRFCSHHGRGHGGGAAHGGGSGPTGGGGGGAAKPVDLGSAADGEVAKVGASMSKDWHDGLGKGEKAAIEHYSSNDFVDINRYCRKGSTLSLDEAKAGQTVKGVDKALAAARLKEPMVVYRGVSNIGDLGLSEGSLKGATIHDSAFLSTSLSPKVCHDFVGKKGALLKITAPAGSHGASMHGLSKFGDEHEVLFARGSKLRVKGHSRDSEGRLVIEAELSHGGKSGGLPLDAKAASAKARREARFGWAAGDVTVRSET